MACLNMQVKNEKQLQGGVLMGPRISFSNDFVESNLHHHENNNIYREAPVSSDFEFSVPSFSSNSADEVFFKGKVMPLKQEKVVTLRDELLADDENDDIFFPNKNSSPSVGHGGWWREKFGLRKTNQNGKSDHKNLGGLETIDEAKIKPTFFNHTFTGSNRYK